MNFKGILRSFDRPLVMGILNMTPDSFYADSRVSGEIEVISRVRRLLDDGADIIDVGGYSSRPGADNVTEEEEINRIEKPIKIIHKEFPDVLISIDTFRANVARVALNSGASMINDISGGMIEPQIMNVAAEFSAPYILMHMRGTPQTMQTFTDYQDIVKDLVCYFQIQIQKAKNVGVIDIILDPGFGFSKNIDQNFELLKRMDEFKVLDCPLLVGVSRKSMVYKFLEISAEESLNGTTVLNTFALNKGASVLRVHDVKEARQAVDLMQKLSN